MLLSICEQPVGLSAKSQPHKRTWSFNRHHPAWEMYVSVTAPLGIRSSNVSIEMRERLGQPVTMLNPACRWLADCT